MPESLKKLVVVRESTQLEACRDNILRATLLIDILRSPVRRDPLTDDHGLAQSRSYLEEALNCLDNAR